MTNSIQILLAIGTRSDYEIWNMDVKTTFHNGFVEEEIYIVQLKDFTFHEKNRRPIVSKCPSMASNKLSKAGTHVLMKSYGVMISSRMNLILVYSRRSVGARLRTLCFMYMISY